MHKEDIRDRLSSIREKITSLRGYL